MRISLLTLFLAVQIAAGIHASGIEGRVVDCKSQTGIELVRIGIPGSQAVTVSNVDGNFRLDNLAKGNYTLVVSAVGYEDARVPVTVDSHNAPTDILISLCEKSVDLEQLVVTATRTERLLKNVPIQTSMITAKAIDRMQLSNFRDLLEYELPGVEFTNNGGFANINMMGFGGKYVLFLVDGERMAGETFDNIDYNRVDMDNVQQVEIVKGAASSLYGSNAVGGVINVITQKPREAFETGANARYGSNNEQTLRYNIGSRQKWGYANLVASYKSIDPYLLKDIEPETRYFSDGTVVEQPLYQTYIAGYRDFSITPRVGFDLTKNLNIEAKGGYYFKERNAGGLEGSKVSDRYFNYSGGLKLDYKISEKQSLTATINMITSNCCARRRRIMKMRSTALVGCTTSLLAPGIRWFSELTVFRIG